MSYGNRGGRQQFGGSRGGRGFDPNAPIRIRTPRPGELFGVVTELFGGSRMSVQCEDGKKRLCRIPGKIRSKLWIRPGDVVLFVPWSVESDSKADLAYRYTAVQVDALRRKGLLRLKLD